ncbi:MAG: phosphoribosylformylglycinamidine synthase [Planctomycetes bacterium]|nr:phosphoribosylformylglycinamidine synthase [Planctomycetota bacterium]
MAGKKIGWRVCVNARDPEFDAKGRSTLAELKRAGFCEVAGVRATRIYELLGTIDAKHVSLLCDDLFVDAAIETVAYSESVQWPPSSCALVEVHLQPGIMDPVAQSALVAANDLLSARGVTQRVEFVQTAWRYEIEGVLSLEHLQNMSRRVLANGCIETVFIHAFGHQDSLPIEAAIPIVAQFELKRIVLVGKREQALDEISRDGRLFLSTAEMKAIQAHFEGLGRDPTDIELETIAQTWSEHCIHKTIKSGVNYRGKAMGGGRGDDVEIERSYGNLLADTIVKVTRELDCDWCLSVFEDNAGVVAFDDEYGIAFKVETHNHPSAIEPYAGAATGVGGCVRDILGCGLGAKPIANTDVFCVAAPDWNVDRVPAGVLHPGRVLRGIVSGVRDYGNRMGIPTVAGGLHFDDRYLANPLVFVGSVGLIPRKHIAKAPCAGDLVVVVGGRTGRDGIGGATFSSGELTDTHAELFAHAVQIGNPIEEKKLLDALLIARDHTSGCLYSSATDCGAGGLSSAVGEMAAHLGAVIDLDRVLLKYSGLRYNEIWLSEAQERMVLSVPPENFDALRTIFDHENVELAAVGTFTDDGELVMRFEGAEVGRLGLDFMHDGIPRANRTARWSGSSAIPNDWIPYDFEGIDLRELVLSRLTSIDACSREAIFRQYDHEVQGGSVIKPLVGMGEGPSDAAVVVPFLDQAKGVAIGMGMCSDQVEGDPYWMAIRSVDEAIRNVVCVGADPSRIAVLDNFCWGGCDNEHAMGALVRACQGCHDAALAYRTPFISGKDSLNNQFRLAADDAKQLGLPQRLAIPPTLLISAMGHVEDVRKCVTSDLKRGSGRLVAAMVDWTEPNLSKLASVHARVAELIRGGHVRACHDFSDEGIVHCVAEMCIGGRCGARIEGGTSLYHAGLYCDRFSGYVLQLENEVDLSNLSASADVLDLGCASDDGLMCIRISDIPQVKIEVAALARAWRSGLVECFGGDSHG